MISQDFLDFLDSTISFLDTQELKELEMRVQERGLKAIAN